ncbi:Sodium- and chloride-dependent GABA transporter 3 [Channa argus]|uniref:Sodium-and chloride-dependent GABA transporter 3 n=1 Tax=Channa argus TaxID=215402 RepID=A0A6G1Q7Q9_CHAAH|nr:Sodium- and chloride-dependent GABA transporter 3 [Channa argus]
MLGTTYRLILRLKDITRRNFRLICPLFPVVPAVFTARDLLTMKGAFLVPYGLLALVCGIPLFLMETSSGQYTQEGFITCWRKLCPLAEGIGYGFFMMKLYDFSYILIQVWALFYLVFSFKAQLPWASCDNTWNTASCLDLQILNSTNVTATAINTTSAATEFWECISGAIWSVGPGVWDTSVPNGDFQWSVHPGRIHHLLEEIVPTGRSYILIQAWALFYLVFSFKAQLPWASCDNTWNTASCLDLQILNSTNVTANQTNTTSAATEFWE